MKRCAIYTRKSTEEGLEQEFNSLDAQREACEAYIVSQKHEGWKLVREKYDDGGFSGGNMDRPALKKLLNDIAAKKVDVVVVYKVDRLTRSLADFAKIVDVFDRSGVSFVSITQQFNTTTSMGRLTLNMLLSFAQFEREVTSERIRDKFAASKAKGMWMGGTIPLGYDLKERRLLTNEAEAKTVRTIYELYNKLGSVDKLKIEIDRLKLTTKARPHRVCSGSRPFSRGHLYQILGNVLYAGQIAHKGKAYPGLHQAIIERPLWDQVQDKLKSHCRDKKRSPHIFGTHLLTGLVFEPSGQVLTSVHTARKNKRYRYYVSRDLMDGGRKPKNDIGGLRIPAKEIETIILLMLQQSLNDQKWLLDQLEIQLTHSSQINSILMQAKDVAKEFTDAVTAKEVLRLIVERIVVHVEKIEIVLSSAGFRKALGLGPKVSFTHQNITICKSIRLGRRGKVTKLIIGSVAEEHNPGTDPHLVMLLVRAHDWYKKMTSGQFNTIGELAKIEKYWGSSRITRTMQLTFLAPDIIEAILNGGQPAKLTANNLMRALPLPLDWREQRRILGLTRPR